MLPLDGVRVLELGYGIAAPVAARNLAQFGADVIRVESARKPDSLRLGGAGWLPPGYDWSVRRDTIPALNFSSPEKRSLGLEIDNDEGRAAFERLVAVTDVVITNVSDDALGALHVGYDDVRALRPDIIHVTLPAFGSAGPYRTYRTWGHNLSAAAGIDHLIGWPDRDPVQIGFAYPDFVSAQAATVAVLAALRRRRRTGTGAHIEVWQYAMALACLGPAIVAAQVEGIAPSATGNRAPDRAPQGVYRSRGEERWVAITVEDDAMWAALCRVPGLESLATDSRFASLDARIAHHDALDAQLTAWTRTRTDWEAASELQVFGVAASPVMDGWDVVADSQLAARDFFQALPHARFARDLVFGQAVRLSDTPPRAEHAAPGFGEHSRAILRDLAGLDDATIDRLVDAGVVHVMVRDDVALERPYLHWLRKVQRLLPWGQPTF
ncbi:MAG TPA: CoA transferase, partial [Acidimicrobiia bacterium]|nr:CoA transferase [Acidimicrobiia bacterium]